VTTQSTYTTGNRELLSADSTRSLGHRDGNGDGHGTLLDAERLDCYRIAREMRSLIAPILPTLSRTLRDQLDRASLSVPLNIAEAMGSHYLLEATACGKRGSWLLQVAEATSIRSPRRRPLVMWT
jgi:hypothetical protein